MIPPLLTLPPPPRGRGPVWGDFPPRCGPHGRGWWGVSAEPPFPGPGYSNPSRGGFHNEQRQPRRLRSWSLVKNTCPPKNEPQIMEGEAIFFCACVHLVPITVRVTMTLFLRPILCPLEVGVALNVFSPRRKTAIPEYLEMVGSRKSDCLLCLCSLVTFIFFLTF